MEKTTVYLPADLKSRLAKAAARRRVSEAKLIREGVEYVVDRAVAQKPHLGSFDSGDVHYAERVDQELRRGFGRR